MKITIKIFLFFILSFWGLAYSVASNQVLTRDELFQYFANIYREDTPQSYLYIDVKYNGLEGYPQLERSLQVLIYHDLIKNNSILFRPQTAVLLSDFIILAERIAWVTIPYDKSASPYIVSKSDFQLLREYIDGVRNQDIAPITPSVNNLGKKWDIFFDIYRTLLDEHYNSWTFDQNQLLLWAIRGLTESTWDTYTTYFPPAQSQNFFDGLEWEYEGIGAYVDLPEPWVFIIVTPIVWSPAEAAWIKWWDRVTHVDGREITPDNSSQEIVSWIKWPAWTQVQLTIFRPTTQETFDTQVTRAKITLTDVEHELLDTQNYYIQIKNFWEKVDNEFLQAMEWFESSGATKLIFDFRNNPGWYLWKVTQILSHFVPTGEPVALIKQWDYNLYYESKDIKKFDVIDKKIIMLQNSGTASASEIFIGTFQDYYPEAVTFGEKTFWKWSVQSLKQYYDGSTLRYTTARWYTGKFERAIDGVWLFPDKEIIDDSLDESDKVLEEAKKY